MTAATLPLTSAREQVIRDRQQSIRQAIAARDEGMRLAEDTDYSGWDRNLIDQAIRAFADTGEKFSANDVREALAGTDVRTALMGARFSAAVTRGVIFCTGFERSTKVNTHGKRIAVYRSVLAAEEAR